jgi:hypothetical protein
MELVNLMTVVGQKAAMLTNELTNRDGVENWQMLIKFTTERHVQ